MGKVIIDGNSLDLENFISVTRRGEKVEISELAKKKINKAENKTKKWKKNSNNK